MFFYEFSDFEKVTSAMHGAFIIKKSGVLQIKQIESKHFTKALLNISSVILAFLPIRSVLSII